MIDLRATIQRDRRPLPAHDMTGVNRRLWARVVCEAEIEHARRDWSRLVALHGLAGLFDEHAPWQPHPSDPYRLKHEARAASLLNIEGHLIGANLLLSRAIDMLRAQRVAARKSDQWRERARDTEADIATNLIPRHRALWRSWLDACQRYRDARFAVDVVAMRRAA